MDIASLSTIYTITKMVVSLPLSYYGGKGNIPMQFVGYSFLAGVGVGVFGGVGFMGADFVNGVLGGGASSSTDGGGGIPTGLEDNSSSKNIGAGIIPELLTKGYCSITNITVTACSNIISEIDSDSSIEIVAKPNNVIYVILALAMMANAVGMACVFTLGPAYINANCKPEKVRVVVRILFTVLFGGKATAII